MVSSIFVIDVKKTKNTEGVFLIVLSGYLSFCAAYCSVHHTFQSVRFSEPHQCRHRAVQKGILCTIIRPLSDFINIVTFFHVEIALLNT